MSDFKIHVLDMGRQMYGDCLLVEDGDTRILIDGGHQSDYEGQEGYESIPDQLKSILGEPPFKISLLIVTHCHADHIGCLPDLVKNRIIKPTWALVADERLGFGRVSDDAPLPTDALPSGVRAVAAALREEDRSSMDDADLAQFLQDAVKLEDRYKEMLASLSRSRTKIVRYGRDPHAVLEQEFSSLGFEILGPTKEHLAICAEAISKLNKDAADQLTAAGGTDDSRVLVDTYRKIAALGARTDALDRPGKGAALNNQSIVFKIVSRGNVALFAGDMQFAKSEVRGLDPEMQRLRAAVAAAGPYRFAKLTHHTSYNGVDDSVLDDFGKPSFLVHTGGLNDPGHPDSGALATLKARSREFKLARTDRNGLVTFGFDDAFEISRGRLNDFTPNAGGDVSGPETRGELVISPPADEPPLQTPVAGKPSSIDVIFMRIPYENGRITIGDIPITIEAPAVRTRISPVVPSPQGNDVNPPILSRPANVQLGSGRKLPPLLFLTSSERLAKNVGKDEARFAAELIKDAGQELFDVSDPEDRKGIQNRLSKGGVDGVVVVGGYDVLPADRVDVLDSALRRRIGAEVSDEPDGFIVWSDDRYGDVDGDGIAELPVSRIPDGYSSELLLRCLSASQPLQNGRFGIRNQERPFADAIWSSINGGEAILISGPAEHTAIVSNDIQRSFIYFMLHGDHADGTHFWGEDGGPVIAMNIKKVPPSGVGTVMAGCCWGALTVNQIASRASGPLAIKTANQSLALSFLAGGASAFVGCTGAHYSPDVGQPFFGEPMHRHFWLQLGQAGKSPATALFEARKAYLKEMPHGLSKPFHLGIERKIYKQFTCLGLGW